MQGRDNPREAPSRAVDLERVVEALQSKNPGKAARRAKAAVAEPDMAPAARSLFLHLGGLACRAAGAREDGARFLEAAARIEREQLGCQVGSQHTVHQLSLLSQEGASMAAAKRYYLETLKTLRSSRNPVGAGLCLRSLGELALVAGAVSEARTCWRRAQQYLEPSAAAEASQLGSWLSLLERAR